jgi:Fe-S-cluster formation regulator IscX/YfhJ
MNSFLYRIAAVFYQHFGNEINTFTFVFPNRRAGIFFQKYLSQIVDKPVFSPEILTIDECFFSSSELQIADRLSMLFKLYRIYKNLSNSDESFDTFAFWGETLLSDFNEIDKYRVDAKQLFTNITELKEIDKLFNIFTEDQIEAIRQFWMSFAPVNETQSQQNFLSTWEILFPLYDKFTNELKTENCGYEGMIFREVVEKLQNNTDVQWFENKHFVFIGFNALNPCEKALFTSLRKRSQADFYWDYEAFELRDNSNPASLFFTENTSLFPSKYNITLTPQSLKDKKIELLSVPSAIGQAKHIYHTLQQLYPVNSDEKSFLKTAVVLPDENLLLPLLYSIPSNINKINVTMGYPLNLTPVAGLMDHIFELHKRKREIGGETKFYHLTVANILNHQFIALICGKTIEHINNEMLQKNLIYVDASTLQKNKLLNIIFNPDIEASSFLEYLINLLKLLYYEWHSVSDDATASHLESGFLYQYYTTVNRINEIIKDQPDDLSINLDTFIRLVKQLTQGISIPFVGEPLEGLQIIGTLETRGLDFENILISSFNEGIYPKKSFSNSFIPYHLRKGFNLPTYEHQDAITSYNFYRLIHRAKKVFFFSDSRIDKGNTGEVSRFYHQLKYHYNLDMKEKTVAYDIAFKSNQPIKIEKNNFIKEKLSIYQDRTFPGKALSASSINTYIQCPLQFYFKYIEGIEASSEVSDNIETDMFGNIFHAVMAAIYEPFKGKLVQPTDITLMMKNETRIYQLLSESFACFLYKKPKGVSVELQGNSLLISKILLKYIVGVLKNDKNHAPFKYINGEEYCETTLLTKYGTVNLKGYIDRIDEKDGNIRILDYKTGSGSLDFKSWDDLFDRNYDPRKRPKHILQTFLYGLLYKGKTAAKVITPGIYYTKNIFYDQFSTELCIKEERNSKIIIQNYYDYESAFISPLINCVEEIFNPDVPFFQTDIIDSCSYCDFKNICKR